METSLTIDYDKQWLNCVSAIGPWDLKKIFVYFKQCVYFEWSPQEVARKDDNR